MLHPYCNRCEWFDETFRECQRTNCDYSSIEEDGFDFGIIEDPDELTAYIHEWFQMHD